MILSGLLLGLGLVCCLAGAVRRGRPAGRRTARRTVAVVALALVGSLAFGVAGPADPATAAGPPSSHGRSQPDPRITRQVLDALAHAQELAAERAELVTQELSTLHDAQSETDQWLRYRYVVSAVNLADEITALDQAVARARKTSLDPALRRQVDLVTQGLRPADAKAAADAVKLAGRMPSAADVSKRAKLDTQVSAAAEALASRQGSYASRIIGKAKEILRLKPTDPHYAGDVAQLKADLRDRRLNLESYDIDVMERALVQYGDLPAAVLAAERSAAAGDGFPLAPPAQSAARKPVLVDNPRPAADIAADIARRTGVTDTAASQLTDALTLAVQPVAKPVDTLVTDLRNAGITVTRADKVTSEITTITGESTNRVAAQAASTLHVTTPKGGEAYYDITVADSTPGYLAPGATGPSQSNSQLRPPVVLRQLDAGWWVKVTAGVKMSVGGSLPDLSGPTTRTVTFRRRVVKDDAGEFTGPDTATVQYVVPAADALTVGAGKVTVSSGVDVTLFWGPDAKTPVFDATFSANNDRTGSVSLTDAIGRARTRAELAAALSTSGGAKLSVSADIGFTPPGMSRRKIAGISVKGTPKEILNSLTNGIQRLGQLFGRQATPPPADQVVDSFLVDTAAPALPPPSTTGQTPNNSTTADDQCNCFPAGTLVATGRGEVPIQDIRVGDQVWAHDLTAGRTEMRQVTALFHRKADRMLTLDVSGVDVQVTPDHLFWSPGRGWVPAGTLRVGDPLSRQNGGTAVVRAVTARATATTVYNFTVAGDHDYYVSPAQLLVHNCAQPARRKPTPWLHGTEPTSGQQALYAQYDRTTGEFLKYGITSNIRARYPNGINTDGGVRRPVEIYVMAVFTGQQGHNWSPGKEARELAADTERYLTLRGGGPLNDEDWFRDNHNNLVQPSLYDTTGAPYLVPRSVRPVGISAQGEQQLLDKLTVLGDQVLPDALRTRLAEYQADSRLKMVKDPRGERASLETRIEIVKDLIARLPGGAATTPAAPSAPATTAPATTTPAPAGAVPTPRAAPVEQPAATGPAPSVADQLVAALKFQKWLYGNAYPEDPGTPKVLATLDVDIATAPELAGGADPLPDSTLRTLLARVQNGRQQLADRIARQAPPSTDGLGLIDFTIGTDQLSGGSGTGPANQAPIPGAPATSAVDSQVPTTSSLPAGTQVTTSSGQQWTVVSAPAVASPGAPIPGVVSAPGTDGNWTSTPAGTEVELQPGTLVRLDTGAMIIITTPTKVRTRTPLVLPARPVTPATPATQAPTSASQVSTSTVPTAVTLGAGSTVTGPSGQPWQVITPVATSVNSPSQTSTPVTISTGSQITLPVGTVIEATDGTQSAISAPTSVSVRSPVAESALPTTTITDLSTGVSMSLEQFLAQHQPVGQLPAGTGAAVGRTNVVDQQQGTALCNCFPAGTPVATARGEVPIQNIRTGDQVWAHDLATGHTELRQVTALFHRQASEMLTIDVSGIAVQVTPDHPFWVPGRGWVTAGELRAGDELSRRDGGTARVRAVTARMVDTTVYNFTVAGDHDYYVSPAQLLVHNCTVGPTVNGVAHSVTDASGNTSVVVDFAPSPSAANTADTTNQSGKRTTTTVEASPSYVTDQSGQEKLTFQLDPTGPRVVGQGQEVASADQSGATDGTASPSRTIPPRMPITFALSDANAAPIRDIAGQTGDAWGMWYLSQQAQQEAGRPTTSDYLPTILSQDNNGAYGAAANSAVDGKRFSNETVQMDMLDRYVNDPAYPITEGSTDFTDQVILNYLPRNADAVQVANSCNSSATSAAVSACHQQWSQYVNQAKVQALALQDVIYGPNGPTFGKVTAEDATNPLLASGQIISERRDMATTAGGRATLQQAETLAQQMKTSLAENGADPNLVNAPGSMQAYQTAVQQYQGSVNTANLYDQAAGQVFGTYTANTSKTWAQNYSDLMNQVQNQTITDAHTQMQDYQHAVVQGHPLAAPNYDLGFTTDLNGNNTLRAADIQNRVIAGLQVALNGGNYTDFAAYAKNAGNQAAVNQLRAQGYDVTLAADGNSYTVYGNQATVDYVHKQFDAISHQAATTAVTNKQYDFEQNYLTALDQLAPLPGESRDEYVQRIHDAATGMTFQGRKIGDYQPSKKVVGWVSKNSAGSTNTFGSSDLGGVQHQLACSLAFSSGHDNSYCANPAKPTQRTLAESNYQTCVKNAGVSQCGSLNPNKHSSGTPTSGGKAQPGNNAPSSAVISHAAAEKDHSVCVKNGGGSSCDYLNPNSNPVPVAQPGAAAQKDYSLCVHDGGGSGCNSLKPKQQSNSNTNNNSNNNNNNNNNNNKDTSKSKGGKPAPTPTTSVPATRTSTSTTPVNTPAKPDNLGVVTLHNSGNGLTRVS